MNTADRIREAFRKAHKKYAEEHPELLEEADTEELARRFQSVFKPIDETNEQAR